MQIESTSIPFKFTLADALAALDRELQSKGYQRTKGTSLGSDSADIHQRLMGQSSNPSEMILFSGTCEPVLHTMPGYRGDPYEGRGGPGDR